MYKMCIRDFLIYILLRALEILTCSYWAWVSCLVIFTPWFVIDTRKKACGICRMHQILSSLIISIHGEMTRRSFLHQISSQHLKKKVDQILCHIQTFSLATILLCLVIFFYFKMLIINIYRYNVDKYVYMYNFTTKEIVG